MADGVVGKVKIKVIPDTSDFKEDLKRGVKRAADGVEAEVGAKLGKNAERELKESLRSVVRNVNAVIRGNDRYKLKVGVKLDERGVLGELKRLVKQLQAATDDIKVGVDIDREAFEVMQRKMRDSMQDAKARVEVDIDVDDASVGKARALIQKALAPAKGYLAKVRAELDDQFYLTELKEATRARTLEIKAHFDDSAFGRAYNTFWAKVKKDSGGKTITFGANIDQDGFDKKLDSILSSIRSRREDVKVGASLDKSSLASVRAQLAAFAKASVIKVKATIDSSAVSGFYETLRRLSGQRVHWDLISPGIDTMKNFDRVAISVGKIAPALAMAAAGAADLAGVLLGIGAALGSVTKGMIALPGMAISAGVAMKMFSQAVSKIAESRGVDKLSAALKRSASVLDSSVIPSFDRLASKILPSIEKGSTSAYRALGKSMSKLLDSLGKQGSAIDAMYQGITGMFKNMEAGAPALANLAGTLLKIGSKYMPQLGSAISNAVKDMDSFVSQAYRSGEAFRWVEKAKADFKNLWSGTVDLAKTFGNLAEAASAAGYGAKGFAESMDRIEGVTSSAGFQKGLTDVLRSARDTMNDLGTRVGPSLSRFFSNFSRTLARVMPIAGRAIGEVGAALLDSLASPKLQTDIVTMFTRLEHGFKTLTPYLKNVGPLLGSLGKIAGAVADNFAALVGRALDGLAPALESLVGPIDRATYAFADGLGDALDALMPMFQGLAPVVGEVAEALGLRLGTALTIASPGLKDIGRSISDLAGNWLPSLARGFGDAAMMLGRFIGDNGSRIANFIGRLDELGSAFGRTVKSIFNVKKDSDEGARKAGDDFGASLAKFITDAAEEIKKIANDPRIRAAIKQVFRNIGTAFMAAARRMVSDLRSNMPGSLSQVYDIVYRGIDTALRRVGTSISNFNWAGLGQRLSNGVRSIFDTVARITPSLGNNLGFAVKGALGGISTALQNFDWAGTGRSFANAVGGLFRGVAPHLPEVGANLGSAISSAVTGALTSIHTALEQWRSSGDLAAFSRGFGEGIAEAIKNVDWASVGVAFMEAFNSLHSVAIEIGGNVLKGFIQGLLPDSWDGVAGQFVDGFVRVVKTLLGIHSPSTVFIQIGKDVVQGFINGITQMLGTLGSIAGQMATTVIDAIKELPGRVGSVWEQVKTGTSAAWSSISSTTSRAWSGIKAAASAGASAVGRVVSTGWNAIKSNTSTAWSGIKSAASSVWGGIKSAASSGVNGVKSTVSSGWSAVKSNTSTAWNGIKSAVTTGVNGAKSVVSSGWSSIKSNTSSAWSSVKSNTSSAWESVKSTISSGMSSAKSTMSSGWSSVKSTTSSAWSGIQSAVSSGWSSLKSTISSGMSSAQSTMSSGWSSIKSTTSSAMSSVRSTVSSGMSSARSALSSAMSGMRSTTSSAMSSLRGAVSSAMSSARSAVSSAGSSMSSSFSGAANRIAGIAQGLRGRISGAFSSLPGQMASIGSMCMNGLARGISAAGGRAIAMARSVASRVIGITRSMFNTHSPSRVFMEIGNNLGEGLAIGMEQRELLVEKATKTMLYVPSKRDVILPNVTGGNVSTANLRETSRAMGEADLAGGGTGASINVTQNIQSIDPYATARISSDQLAFAVASR